MSSPSTLWRPVQRAAARRCGRSWLAAGCTQWLLRSALRNWLGRLGGMRRLLGRMLSAVKTEEKNGLCSTRPGLVISAIYFLQSCLSTTWTADTVDTALAGLVGVMSCGSALFSLSSL